MEMIGNEEARAAAVTWLSKWKAKTKPVLLVGPPGTGKTTLAFLIAERFGYDVIGLNASDVRSKSKMDEILSPVLKNSGVTGRPPLIFIDEVDGIHGRSDYGGSAALARLMKKPAAPIILAANDDSADKMKPIVREATVIRFKRIPPRLLKAYLEYVLGLEDASSGGGSPAAVASKKITYGTFVMIINRSKGDVRSMMNLAQSYATGFDLQTETPEDVLAAEQAVPAFFGADSAQEAMGILVRMQSDPREKIGAFYSSVVTASNIGSGHRAALLRVISEADMLYGRILRTQNWRLLRYLNGILVGLYGIIPRGTAVKYVQYNVPWMLLSRIRFDGAKIRSLAAHMCPLLHTSASSFGFMYMPYMLYCMRAGSLDVPDPEDAHGEIITKEIGRLAARRQ